MVFEEAVKRLIELGFFKFILPFIIISAIIYAVLRRTQVLGESPIINGLISISIAFFVFGLPVLTGASLTKPLTSFFGQIAIVILIISFGLLITGLFVPDLMGKLSGWITGGGIVWWMITLVVIIALSSGLFAYLTSPIAEAAGEGKNIVLVVVLLLIFIGIIAGVSGGKK